MYSVKECCRVTGLGYHTRKYYCSQRLVSGIKREENSNYKLCEQNDIDHKPNLSQEVQVIAKSYEGIYCLV